MSLYHKNPKNGEVECTDKTDRNARAVLPDKITRRVRQRENAFLIWQIFFGKVKKICLLPADLNNRKEADVTADCIKTGL